MKSRLISDSVISEIQLKTDIVELISSYTSLKKVGNTFKACCPFHQEKTPSFVVNQDRQFYHCFGCGKGGNAFTFIREKEGLDFVGAVHFLADRCGIVIETVKDDGSSKSGNASIREKLFAIQNNISEWFMGNLTKQTGRDGDNYLKSRNISREIIELYKIGFTPDSFDSAVSYLKTLNYSDEEIIESGIGLKKEGTNKLFDRFRNRVMFSISDERGRIVGFSGRAITKEFFGGKYVNSPETPIFKKGFVLYGLNIARPAIKEKEFVILCEGQIDVISMYKAGYKNAVAPQGTAFTEDQARMLKRYTDCVYICFDGDEAGIKATSRAVEILLGLDFYINVISLPKGEDPDSMFEKYGANEIEKYVSASKNFFDYMISIYSNRHNLNSPEGKSAIAREAVILLSKIKNNITRASFAAHLSNLLSINDKTLFKEIDFIIRNGEKKHEHQVLNESSIKVEEDADSLILDAQATLLELVIADKSIGRRLSNELSADMIGNGTIGEALNSAIGMVLNDEWENINMFLLALFEQSGNSRLGRLLAETSPVFNSNNSEKLEKAYSDCLKTIKILRYKEDISRLMQALRDSNQNKDELLKKISDIQKQIMIFHQR